MLTSQSEHPRSIEPVRGTSGNDNPGRRIQRISLPLPVRVEVMIDSTAHWNEITRLSDVSAFGAGFMLKRPLKRGRMILLTMPLPRQLRSFDYSEPQCRVWAIVRRCIPVEKHGPEPQYAIGVAFTGKNPPAGFVDNPSKLYDIASGSNSDGFCHLAPADLMADETELPQHLRKQTRFHIPEELVLQKIDELANVLEEERTVTENISIGGASVFTSIAADVGDFFRVISERFDVTILSVVRTKRVGQDGMTRLHLEFIDRLFPLEGIETNL